MEGKQEPTTRLQSLGGDTVVEITRMEPVKERLSQQALLRQEAYLVQSIDGFEEALAIVRAKLAQIENAKGQA